jgi:hypothetical protein
VYNPLIQFLVKALQAIKELTEQPEPVTDSVVRHDVAPVIV